MTIKWTFILPAIALIITGALWWAQQRAPAPHIISLPVSQSCQLHEHACSNEYQTINIILDITPKPVPIAKQLNVTAKINGTIPTQVQLDINGSNMYMGYNRITLKPQAEGNWSGKSLLAFCTTDTMQWQLTLLIDLPDGTQIQAPFLLTTPFLNSLQ